ncbi:MAG: radical SAM protein [Sedimentisphaerales bacterium]|nr:radical SAM protein [Sedimentisphaerales bacterium]
MDTEQKLNILAESSKFDLACACKPKDEPGRVRGVEGRWIYPAALPNGRKMFLLKTLQTNTCVNDCSYCPFNCQKDSRRVTLAPDDLAQTFRQLHHAKLVEGLFLSSAVVRDAESTMERMLATVEIIRLRYRFKGFIHLKIIPGSSEAAVTRAVQLADRVSVNMEAPTPERLARLSAKKRFHEDIVNSIKLINKARWQLGRQNTCRHTTQFVVGAAEESDKEIITATDRLYQAYELERAYFSAYQPPAPQEQSGVLFQDAQPLRSQRPAAADAPTFMREHRLYQVDFLLRRYGFARDEILFDTQDRLPLEKDPKRIYADTHPELFPIDLNTADREMLLRVPGLGPIAVRRILKLRRQQRIRQLEDLKSLRIHLPTVAPYVKTPSRSPISTASVILEPVANETFQEGLLF